MADPDAFLRLDPDEVLVQLCKDLGVTPPTFHVPAPALPPAFATGPAAGANGHDPPDSS
jgi:hypothetical protein